IDRLNGDLLDRAAKSFPRIACEELLRLSTITDPKLVEVLEQVARARELPVPKVVATSADKSAPKPNAGASGSHHGGARGPLPLIDPHPAFDALVADLSKSCAGRVILWPRDRDEMAGSYG